ncbi:MULTISPECIES: FadR/GntR family transcriptional regulator [Paenibacillus]|uniref:FadR/GntR family transcriptional regulator n=1 Tax=Paenibacillus TaxID=44249 RepID=UPI002FE02BA2
MDLSKKNVDIVTEEIRRIIESGHVKPGQKLDTMEALAARFRVGRSTVREAISHLKAQGLIETRQGGGTYVRAQAPDLIGVHKIARKKELIHLLQVRKMLEVGSIGLAADFRTAMDLEELRKIVGLMEEAIGNEAISQVYDVNFHLAVAKATQNQMLQGMMESISEMMFRTMRDTRSLWLFSEQESAQRLFQEHKKMLHAIEQQDSREASRLMDLHLTKAGKEIAASMDI